MTQAELRQRVTDKIVAAMAVSQPPWRMPYRQDPNSGFPANIISSERYKGVNLLLLQSTAMDREYKSKWWATYGQFKKMGAQVKRRPDNIPKGEWGSHIVFYRPVKKDEEASEAEDGKKNFFFVLKAFTVFNVDQVDGEHLSMFRCNEAALEDRFLAMLNYDLVDATIEATGAKITQGDMPFYDSDADTITMPKKSRFHDLKGYYGAVLHELIHWSLAKSRLDWPGKLCMEKGDAWAMEELIAEIGACYLENELEIPHCEDMSNHNAYLQRWLQVLRGNSRRIFDASSQAVKAVDYILQFSRG